MALERRYAGCHLGRRLGRGPNDASGTDPYRAALGPLAVEMWHSQLGIATVSGNADTWTGQWGGRVLQAPGATQRPVYAADGSAFGGKPVVQTATAGTLYLAGTGLPALALTGSRPYVLLRARMRSTGGSFPHMFGMGAAGDLFQLFDFSAASFRFQFNGSVQVADGSPPLTVVTVEAWLDGANINISINGGTSSAASVVSLTSDITSVWVGNSSSIGVTCADSSHALAIVGSAYPGATVSGQLRALAAAEFPP